ncbi:MAG: hypothetical protein HOP23_15490 [Methylococcaceae bacterium]|nr:hypothetical protein [Methylococcaceae bacterium]
MSRFAVILLSILLQSCSDYLAKQNTPDTGYFSDASDCIRSSERKIYVKVPTAGTMTVVEVPSGNDATVFSLCMEHAGHPPTHTDSDNYLNVSRASQQVRNSSNTDEAYAKCVRHSKITIEAMIPEKSD